MKRYCLALDLKDDPALVAAYEAHHRAVWPEIEASIREAGILNLEIYRTANRLMMVMETEDDFSFEKKALLDEGNPRVQEWEALQGTFQQSLPHAANGEKWVRMDLIYSL